MILHHTKTLKFNVFKILNALRYLLIKKEIIHGAYIWNITSAVTFLLGRHVIPSQASQLVGAQGSPFQPILSGTRSDSFNALIADTTIITKIKVLRLLRMPFKGFVSPPYSTSVLYAFQSKCIIPNFHLIDKVPCSTMQLIFHCLFQFLV